LLWSLHARNACALIPFITAGDPDLETTAKALQVLDSHGADIELGVPYPDPLADGPVIQAAATRALQRGTRLEQVLEMVEVLAQRYDRLSSSSPTDPILNRAERFLQQLARVGVAGLVV